MELLGRCAADQASGKAEPSVGDLITLVIELGISEDDVERFLAIESELHKLEAFLQSDTVQGHIAEYREHLRDGNELDAEFERQKRAFETAKAEWARRYKDLESRSGDIRRGQHNEKRLKAEREALERKFRHLPPTKPAPINVPTEEKLYCL